MAVRGPATDEASIAACAEAGLRMGKEVAVVKEPESAVTL